MVSSNQFSLIFLLLLLAIINFTHSTDLTITIVNNCPYTIWPAIQPTAGYPILDHTGFQLEKLTHFSFPAPQTQWSGRIWARTGCIESLDRFTCATGDCGGHLECVLMGGATPTTLAQISVHNPPNDDCSYDVSLLDGFNIPMTVTPHEGKGNCPVVGCREDILATCPDPLRMRSSSGAVVGCMSGCEVFGTDELCCRNHYNSPQTCKASNYSEFFKVACPDTVTYAHDSLALYECSSVRELKVIFCH
ncbi:osmotin-like protein [Impatiens glandulifera]|uniref:osmotin-like protein n=1 Tax=Impatiens glandulifera TaxID=253017 RepID=UPI001FB12CEB|nr:osmotin-like protein [Impatiens glandulifera]